MRVDSRHTGQLSSYSRPQHDNEKGGEAHAAAERRAEEEEVELRMPGSFDFEDHDSDVVGVAGAGTVDSVRCDPHAWELVAAHTGEMMVRTRRTFRSFRISFHLEFIYRYSYTGSIVFSRFPLVSVWS
jgi:hypothetical protein